MAPKRGPAAGTPGEEAESFQVREMDEHKHSIT